MKKDLFSSGANYTLTPEEKGAILQILKDNAREDVESIEETTSLKEELGIDSLDLIEVEIDIERHFSILLGKAKEDDLKTVEDIYRHVSKALSQK